jgi:hypothetical protein
MENILVGLIVGGALVFSLRSFIKIYKGEGDCSCGSACGCSSAEQQNCGKTSPFIQKKN